MKGKTAIVTGSANPLGIGFAAAKLLAERGANVVLADIDAARVEESARALQQAGLSAMPVVCDVTDETAVRNLAAVAQEKFGAVDVLVNNAGGSARIIGKQTKFIESTPDTWDWVMRLNLRGPMLLIHAVLPGMIERRYGRIVNLASIAGIRSLSGYADYSASKGGLIAFSRTLAQEVGEYGITVNCIAPGSIATRGTGPDTFLRRLGEAEEVAKLIGFLASDDSSFITGQCYPIDGGRSITSSCK